MNLAQVPGTTLPVNVNNINNVTNASFYVNNPTGGTYTELDGHTVVLEAFLAGLIPGETYHIKLAISDAGDSILDSTVFIETGSFYIPDKIPPSPVCRTAMVELEQSGTGHLDADEVNDGSHDNCELANLDVYPNTFGMDDLGEQDVTLYAADESGNTASCNTTVTVMEMPVGIDDIDPTHTHLGQNYPNPVHQSTTIEYHLAQAGKVELTLYNLLGERVQVWVNSWQSAGNHSFIWYRQDVGTAALASGMYFYTLTTDEGEWTRAMVVE